MTSNHPPVSAPTAALALIDGQPATTDEALAIFDALPAAHMDTLWGEWSGGECNTGHPSEGLLDLYGWKGKTFVDPDTVHPLVFRAGSGKTRTLEPRLLFPGLNLPAWLARSRVMTVLFRLFRPLLATRRARARLRMIEHRGVVTATMAYDHLPIHDVFRRVDDDTLLGCMDLKGDPQPYFFYLRRD